MGWLAGYQYRKKITINHTADGAQTNYQMKLAVVFGLGTDSTSTVYLNNKAMNWPYDVRFTTADGTTLLDHWREEYDATDGTWWIEIDSIPAHPDDFTGYIYYGDADASDASSGANTFGAGKFDDFEWGSNGDNINTSGGNITWTEVATNCDISTTQAWGGTRSLKALGTSAEATCPLTAVTIATYAIYVRCYFTSGASCIPICGHGNGTNAVVVCFTAAGDFDYVKDAGTYVDTTKNAVAGWNVIEIKNINFTARSFDMLLNGVSAGSGITYNGVAWGTNVLKIVSANGSTVFYMDNVIIRNWTANEPTWGSWGTEESRMPGSGSSVSKMMSLIMTL